MGGRGEGGEGEAKLPIDLSTSHTLVVETQQAVKLHNTLCCTVCSEADDSGGGLLDHQHKPVCL